MNADMRRAVRLLALSVEGMLTASRCYCQPSDDGHLCWYCRMGVSLGALGNLDLGGILTSSGDCLDTAWTDTIHKEKTGE